MKIIDVILKGVSKVEDVLKVVKALFAGVETFVSELKKSQSVEAE